MKNMPDTVYALKLRIEAAEQPSDIVSVLALLAPLLAENSTSQELTSLQVAAFHALQVLTIENVIDGEQYILTYLLNYLEKDSNGTTVQKSATRQLRECLQKWIEQYSEQESIALRQHVLEALLLRFQARPSNALCWTFSHIGYRNEHIVRALLDYALQEESEGGDIALATITALGTLQQEHPRLLEALHRKMHRQVTQPLLIALTRLADRASFEVICETCFPSLTPGGNWPATFLEISLSLGVLVKIADTYEKEEELQDSIWRFIAMVYEKESTQIASVVNLGGNIVQQCDSKHVIPRVLTWLGQAFDDEQKRQERNPILLYRLQECIRPRQVAGWQQRKIPSVIPILRQSACLDTHFAGRSATREMHTKESAWGALLCLGYIEALGWFEEAVSQETNPYLRGELCDLFACFRLDPLPRQVLSSLTERYDAKRSDPTGQVSAEISVRLGAMKVARSSCSWDVFEALLVCGLTVDEQPLLAWVEALIDVACVLAQKGLMAPIVGRLVMTIADNSRSACRLAAARTLEALMSEQEVPSSLLKPLLNILLTQNDRDSFERSIIASALLLHPSFANDLLSSLKQWAQGRDDELARLSFSILARRGMLLSEEPLVTRLGLQIQGQEVRTRPNFNHPDWWVQVIGLLYLSHPTLVTPLIANFIHTLPWTSAIQLFRKRNALDPDRLQGTLPREIVTALIERIRQRQTRMGAEIDLIRMAARLIPEELSLEDWDRSWQDWLPNARATLADVLGTLSTLSDAANTHRVRLLQYLTGDGHYIVRRAAYRGLQRCTSLLLQQWCWTWTRSHERTLRLRAAEAWAWLSSEGDEEHQAERLYHLLASDPEPEVRQATQRTRQERRKREWAGIYLAHVLSRNASTSSHADLLAAWPYAEALKRVGDDTTLQNMRTALGVPGLPPHIHHWYQHILKETSEGWEKAMKKWPQPATMWTGTLESGNGVLWDSEETIPVHYTVWRNDDVLLEEASSWGGTVQGEKGIEFFLQQSFLLQHLLFLQLEDRRRGEILLKKTNDPGQGWIFLGQGPFPL